MTNPPNRPRARTTSGSLTVGKFIDRHGLRPVSVYIPIELHRALATIAIKSDTSMQAIVTLACSKYFGRGDPDVPPLLAPATPTSEPRKNFTWYADIELHKRMKLLAVVLSGSVQQLVLSAVVDYMKDAPDIKALRLQTGFPAYARAPVTPAVHEHRRVVSKPIPT